MENNKYNILYVDDEPINLESFKLAFVFNESFEIVTAQSGPEGLDVLSEGSRIHAVVSDMRMPEMDGLTFIKEVKKTNATLPCLILSGYHETDETSEAIKEGLIAKYIMKPYDMKDLEDSLRGVLEIGH